MVMDGFYNLEHFYKPFQSRRAAMSFAASQRRAEMEKMPTFLPPGSKGQQSSLASYLPAPSHIHHEMPFYLTQRETFWERKISRESQTLKLAKAMELKRKKNYWFNLVRCHIFINCLCCTRYCLY